MMRKLALCILVLLIPLAAAATPTVITNDGGGRVMDYDIRFHNPGSWVIDGECASACTMVLGTHRVCATPRAVLEFHSAYIMPSGKISPIANEFMMAHYPPALRRYLTSVGALKRILPMTIVRAPQIWQYVPRC